MKLDNKNTVMWFVTIWILVLLIIGTFGAIASKNVSYLFLFFLALTLLAVGDVALGHYWTACIELTVSSLLTILWAILMSTIKF